MKARLTALAAGTLFGVGLCLGGMTDPRNVIGFLDVTGQWRPELAFVMAGAILVHASYLRWGRGHALAVSSAPPARIDAALLIGAAIFGVGWGLSGYCPGPSVVALGSGALPPLLFVASCVVGMLLVDALKPLPGRIRPPPAARPTQPPHAP